MAPDVQWNDVEYVKMLHDEFGPLGPVLNRAGAIVMAGAKRRALKRTGKMAAEIFYQVGSDATSVYVDVRSPVRSKSRSFPYASVHEGRHVRDRRAHRSLKPALNDLKRL